MLIIFFVVWIKIGYPIFYQKRPGLDCKIFTIYKFKTLHDDFDQDDEIKRQNTFGNFLRKTGLDELPQLFNILKNEMSLIGPRPLLLEYLDKYNFYEKKRHRVKPGLTGLAQVSPSKNKMKSWKKSIRLDVFYCDKLSFFLDLLILCKTIKILILKKKQYNDFSKSI
jgi:lipopolysaccharide/colanic/teichoic acid biosynthesis glycosyltransferase